MIKKRWIEQLAVINFLIFAVSCSQQTGNDSGRLRDSLKQISIPEEAFPLPLRIENEKSGEYKYSGAFSGELEGKKPFYIWFGTPKKDPELKMRYQLIGDPGLKMYVQALDRGPREASCEIEKVKDRIGCVVRARSNGNVYLVRVQNNRDSVVPFRFFVDLRSSERIGFLSSSFFE